jgi:hypothetical protein
MTTRTWIAAMLIAAALYLVIGIGGSELGNRVDPGHVLAWRYAAWIASLAVAVTHIGYEHFARRATARQTATHAAAAVALAAFGLAVAAYVHWLRAGQPGSRSPLLALPLWPVVTAVPAFLAAFAAAAILGRMASVRATR